MALNWDWQNQSHLAPSPYVNNGRGQAPMGGGMSLPLNNSPLPQMPNLSIPGLAPMPKLPQFDQSFPGLPGPNLPGLQSPQLQTQGLGLPSYQRPQYSDLSAGYAGLSNQLMQMLGMGQGGGQGGMNGQVNSAINASPLFASSFTPMPQKRNPGMPPQVMPYMNPQQQGAVGQRFGENASRINQQQNTQLGREQSQMGANFNLDAQNARAGSGLGLMGLLTGMYGDQQGFQNQQQNALIQALMGMLG